MMDLAQGTIDSGATAWVLISAALVLVMTPALAFFYGGMVRRTNVLGLVMQSFAAIGVVSVTWAVLGFSIAFAGGNEWFGGLHFAGLTPSSTGGGVPGLPGLAVPVVAFALYQMMGAVITPALVTGATAERWRFMSYMLFLVLWPLLVYAPVAHWVFSPTGWANRMGALDFAGGIVVHANAGAAAIAMAMLLGGRAGWPQRPESAHSVPLVMIGTGLLWFGWLGYNGGSALTAGGLAASAATNTHLGGATALLTWMAVERVRTGKSTVLGAGCGAIAGLVAVTPAAGYVAPFAAILIGGAAGVLCCLGVGIKSWLRLDDSLDVVAVHLVGGSLGTLCVGLFATESVNPDGANGLFYGGGLGQLGLQALALLVVVAYSLVVTYLIGLVTGVLVGNRVSPRQERAGLDMSQHGEVAYGVDEAEAANPTSSQPPGPGEGLGGYRTAPISIDHAMNGDGWTQPVRAPVVSGFRAVGRPGHEGVDLGASRGTPILAASAGTVAVVRCNTLHSTEPHHHDDGSSTSGCGWYVDIEHPGRIFTRYCHMLARPAVVEGQSVLAGQVIGVVGSAGHSSGPNLHLEVHLRHESPNNGAEVYEPVDPVAFFEQRGVKLGAA
jgi:Amt family ammonium transporter